MRKRSGTLLTAALIALFVAALFILRDRDIGDLVAQREFSGTARIVDGDSLEIADRRVRLFGVDAPELDQSCLDRGGHEYPCGVHARAALRRLVGERPVTCLREGRDRFGRILARCRSAAGEELNTALVLAGWAVAYAGADGNAYRRIEREAQRSRVGLWIGSFTRPEQWRRSETPR